MEQIPRAEQVEFPSFADLLPAYYEEIGILNLLIIFLSIGFSLFILLKTKEGGKEKSIRSICIVCLFTVGWLVLDTGSDLIKCFDVNNTLGTMIPQMVLTNIGERAFQIQAIGCYMILTAGILLSLHIKKK